MEQGTTETTSGEAFGAGAAEAESGAICENAAAMDVTMRI
jgi:hypothetical protein